MGKKLKIRELSGVFTWKSGIAGNQEKSGIIRKCLTDCKSYFQCEINTRLWRHAVYFMQCLWLERKSNHWIHCKSKKFKFLHLIGKLLRWHLSLKDINLHWTQTDWKNIHVTSFNCSKGIKYYYIALCTNKNKVTTVQ